MPAMVLTDAFVELNGTNISSYVKSVSLNLEREAQEDTAFGDTTRQSIPGMKTWGLELEMNQDFAAAALDSILWPLFDAGTVFVTKVRPSAAAISTGNPEYRMGGFIATYPPVGGSVGEIHTTSISIVPSGTSAAITRHTS